MYLASCASGNSSPPSTQLPPTSSTASGPIATSAPTNGFLPLGGPECDPPSPVQAWGDGGLAEVRATATGIEAWGLLWEMPPLPRNEEIKMVWRVTGSGEFDIEAAHDDAPTAPTWGPNDHQESNFERPGDEWGTAFVFASPGCWEITITRGQHSARVWLEVEG